MEKLISGLRVLHIDDSPDFRGAFKSILEKENVVVVSRRDSCEASGLLPGRDFDALAFDSSGSEFAQETRQKSQGVTLIGLSIRPEKMAKIGADAVISKSDPAWSRRVLTVIKARFEDPIPPIIVRSQKAFERDLDDLLKTHYRQWVAYHGDEQIGFGRSQTALIERCFRRGLREDQFVVRSIEPLLADEDLVFPAD
jgi:CheY-like chemotaxis protein